MSRWKMLRTTSHPSISDRWSFLSEELAQDDPRLRAFKRLFKALRSPQTENLFLNGQVSSIIFSGGHQLSD